MNLRCSSRTFSAITPSPPKHTLRLRHPAYVGVGRSRLGYSGRGRRRPRAGLCGRPRRCAPGVLRRSNRLPSNAEAATRGCRKSDPVRLEAGVQMLAEACPGQSAQTWDLLRTVLDEGFQSVDRRLHELGPLQPDRFSLKEANARLSELAQRWRLRP